MGIRRMKGAEPPLRRAAGRVVPGRGVRAVRGSTPGSAAPLPPATGCRVAVNDHGPAGPEAVAVAVRRSVRTGGP